MTTTSQPGSWRGLRASAALGGHVERACAWGFAVLLTVYLGLSGGGYDIVVRSEIGLIIWWFVLLGVLIGVLPRARISKVGWLATVLLGGFLVWTWVGLSWSSSHELTLDEVCRLSTYLGIFLLGLCFLCVDTGPSLINGLACGIAAVCGIAILSKLTPGLFPASAQGNSFYATARLAYPFGYADGVGEYAALGLPLVLYTATNARTLIGRAVACAGILPVLFCIAMTVSRGGILAAAVGSVAFLALVPNRVPRLPTLAIAAAGIAALMVALLHRPALRDSTAVAPAGQRHSMLLILCAVLAVCAVIQAAVVFVTRRRERPGWLYVSRRGARGFTAGLILVVIALVVIGLEAGTASSLWHSFKLWNRTTHSNQYSRLLSLAGSHRYQYWQVAWNAFSGSPFHGIGAGTFRYYWEQHTTAAHAEYILNAHSLWFETLAETGIVGGLLLVGFFVVVVVGGATRALRAAGDRATLIATATAGVLAFCASASFDWVWQIGVVPMVALLLAAVTLVPADSAAPEPRANRRPASIMLRGALGRRAILVPASALAMILILIPLANTIELRSSQAAGQQGHLSQALADANAARAIEPSAASVYLQRALLFEQANDIPAALQQIGAAVAREPDNYDLWWIASRIETEADHPVRALADYRRAKRLYPTSTLLTG